MCPLYEYNCKCGAQWEAVTYTSDKPGLWERECHVCGAVCAPVLSAPSLQFKGPGWAKDGYSSGRADSKE